MNPLKLRSHMRAVASAAGLGLVFVLLGCSNDSTEPEPLAPLQITSVSPGRNVAGTEIGAAVTVVFSAALDPATLTASTFR